MNYSNMIEEKNLKKTFIIATLCSTLVGTFTSSLGLYETLNKRRNQRKTDSAQDTEIKKLKEQVEKAEKRNRKRSGSDSDSDCRRRPPRDDLAHSLHRSGALIRREFDDGYERLGRRYAVGDALTENQLQAQIIALQQTVIHVLQEALYNDRSISQTDMQKLMLATQSAREGSLDALRQQSRRLIEASPAPRALPPPRRSATVSEDTSNSIFCRYSLDLQYIPRKPLAASFGLGGDGRCPSCGVRLAIEAQDFWHIGKRIPVLVPNGRYDKEVLKEREFHLGQRFMVKCHTEDGEYACILCNKHRDVDVVCRDVETLVAHVGRAHEVDEYEREVDLRETVGREDGVGTSDVVAEVRERRLALPEYR
ncbi:hypothetical protein K432DRAFT_430510 [Lepidopterella palustris CBS 459.81]|uniref:Uncharacterized protein n=1 Tax=Lepidopterella palustris CBS 459.81 TaxID=1314670 RepID=A0A8E2DXH9_9PEZI|nr:hypothetical protein K432DRAFT_430510 [Lepidopterella palustris CBS 459.81]